eukprot:2653281-Rhodomonas_salina.1
MGRSHIVSGAYSKGHDGDVWERVSKAGYVAVGGAEVKALLTDHVSFIHSQQHYRAHVLVDPLHVLDERLAAQPLRGAIEQQRLAPGDFFHDIGGGVRRSKRHG